jgi:hypothetical protein
LEEQKVFLQASVGNTVYGNVGSQTGLPVATFQSNSTVLDAANGFSTIKGVGNALIHDLTFFIQGYNFEDLIFSVQEDTTAHTTSTDITIKAYLANGSLGLETTRTLTSGLENYLALALNGNLFSSIRIDSNSGFASTSGDKVPTTGGLDQFKQFEVSGVQAVPVPAAVWLFGSGLLGLIGASRRKSKTAIQA